MNRHVLVLFLCLSACTRDAASDDMPIVPNVYQPLDWAHVDHALPRPAGGRELTRSQTAEVLGTGFCLDGANAAERVQASLVKAGWRIARTERVGDERLDLDAEQGTWVLSGSLTRAPSEACEQGFVYSIRSVEVRR